MLLFARQPEASHGAFGVNDAIPGSVVQVAIDMDTTGIVPVVSSATVPVGGTLEIDVVVDEVHSLDGMSGFLFNLKFDPNVVRINSKNANFMLTPGVSLSQPLPCPGACPTAGNWLAVETEIGGSASGEGVLMRLTLECLTNGVSVLDLANDSAFDDIPDVLNSLGGDLPVLAAVDGQVTCANSTPGQVSQVAIDMDTTGNPLGTGGLLSSLESGGKIAVGSTFDIDVVVDAVDPADGMSGFSFNLKFDPSLVRIVSANANFMLTPGVGPPPLPCPGSCPTPGNWRADVGQMFGNASGEGVLMRLTLQCLANGVSVLDLADDVGGDGIPDILDGVNFGAPIPVASAVDGQIICGDLTPGQVVDPAPLNTNAATDSGGDSLPQVTTDGDGTWIAVWQSIEDLFGTGTDWDIFYARSVDDGETWTDPEPLNTNARIDSGDDLNVELTTDGSGTWIAIWESEDSLSGTIGTDWDILWASSDDKGLSWSDPVTFSTNAAGDYNPQVTADGSGSWVAAWESVDSLGGTIGADRDILFVRSTNNFVTWSPAAELNTNAPTDSLSDYKPQVTVDGNGNWVAVWHSYDTLVGTIGFDLDILVARSTNGGATWSPPEALNANAPSDSGDDSEPQVTTDGDGAWVTVWRSMDSLSGTIDTDGDILVARSANGGVTWSPPEELNTNAATDSGADSQPQVTTDGHGNWVAVWNSGDSLGGTIDTDSDTLIARSTDKGVTWTPPKPLNANAGGAFEHDFYPQLTTDGDGAWVAVWFSNSSFGGTIGSDADILYVNYCAICEEATTESSFDVSYAVSVTDTTPGVARAMTTTLSVPYAGNISWDTLITFDPADDVAPSCNIGGTRAGFPFCLESTDLVGTVSMDTHIGISNNACTQSLIVDFDLFVVPVPDNVSDPRASGNIAYTQPVGTSDRFSRWGTSPIGAGGGTAVTYTGLKADAANIAFENYPEYLLDLYDADGPAGGGNPLVPLAVYGAISNVSGDSIPIYIVIFEPGALAAGFPVPNPLGQATANLGYASQTVLRDPTASAANPGAVRGFCSTSVTTVLNATVGGVTRATNPACTAVPVGTCTALNLAWVASERDLDNDGIENALDTCPFDRNIDGDPRVAGNDPDGDLIDSVCDTVANGLLGPATFDGNDVDSDGWPNLQDNCPLVSNPGQLESELSLGVAPGYAASRADDGGPLGDGLGDACDTGAVNVTYNGINNPALALSSTVANGRWQARGLVTPICYGGTDDDGDGYCWEDTDPFDLLIGNNPLKHSPWTTNLILRAVLGRTSTVGAGSWDTDGGHGIGVAGYDSDWLETYVGTDARQACSLSATLSDEPLDAWLYDVNDDGKVTLGDFLAVAPLFLQTATTNAHKRFDWNGDGSVNLSGLLSIAPVFLRTCG